MNPYIVILVIVLFAIILWLKSGLLSDPVIKLNLDAELVEENNVINVTLTDQQRVKLTISPADFDGDPAQVENVNWYTSDPTILVLTVGEDPMECMVTTTGKVGQAEVVVEGDADLGEGITSLRETAYVTVTQSMATTLNLASGVPEGRVFDV